MERRDVLSRACLRGGNGCESLVERSRRNVSADLVARRRLHVTCCRLRFEKFSKSKNKKSAIDLVVAVCGRVNQANADAPIPKAKIERCVRGEKRSKYEVRAPGGWLPTYSRGEQREGGLRS